MKFTTSYGYFVDFIWMNLPLKRYNELVNKHTLLNKNRMGKTLKIGDQVKIIRQEFVGKAHWEFIGDKPGVILAETQECRLGYLSIVTSDLDDVSKTYKVESCDPEKPFLMVAPEDCFELIYRPEYKK